MSLRLAIALAVYLCLSPAIPTFAQDMSTLEAFCDTQFNAALERGGIPGGAIAVVQNQKVLVAKGYGFADWEAKSPVAPDSTLFEIGSVGKLFTAMAVLQLAERDELGLDDSQKRQAEVNVRKGK